MQKIELDWSLDKLHTYFGMQKCGETDWAMSSTGNTISDNAMHPSSHFQTKNNILKFCNPCLLQNMIMFFTLSCELFN